jgi:hypothetical protein
LVEAGEGSLTAQLAKAAVSVLTGIDGWGLDNSAYQRLRILYDEVFQARLALWQAMVGSAKVGRTFTDVELDYHQAAIDKASSELRRALINADKTAALRALTAHDRELKLRYQIQFDENMAADIDRLVGNAMNSRPTLVVGDKGIAKTQVAKLVASLYGLDPIVISVKGDMMSDELIGKLKHDKTQGTFVFSEGMLLKAMREGRPILLDEINFGDQAIIARLQDILLRRPGDTVYVQESGEEPIVIQPGFTVFATANEASQRYRHREILDPAIRDRFDIITRSYPDMDGSPLLDAPDQLLRLALSSAVDDNGCPSRHISLDVLEAFTRLVHVTQFLYSTPAKDVFLDLKDGQAATSVLEEEQPLMTDCITPRTLSGIVADCANGNLPGMRLDSDIIEATLKTLDQAGSSANRDLAEQARFLLDIDNGIGLDPIGEEDRSKDVFAGLSPAAREALLAASVPSRQGYDQE